MYHRLVCLFVLVALGDVVLVSQQPGSSQLANRLICQKFTDPASSGAFLYATDDFIVPSSAPDGLALVFNFTMARTRSDADPASLTVQLFYTTAESESPGNLFFVAQFTNGSALWNARQLQNAATFSLVVTLPNGEASATNPAIHLDLGRASGVVPRDVRLWVAFYATGPRDFQFSGYEENCLYWVTMAPQPAGGNTSNNSVYYFRDVTNALRNGFSQWTPAQLVEPALGVSSGTYQLAYTATLVTLTPPPATEVPTEEVTTTPSAETEVPTEVNDTIDSGNATAPTILPFSDGSTRSLVLGIVLPLSLVICLCASCYACFVRRRRARKKEKEEQMIDRRDQEGSMGAVPELDVRYTSEKPERVFSKGGSGAKYERVDNT